MTDRSFMTSGKTDLGQDVSVFDNNVTPKEATEHYANTIASALSATGLVEVCEVQAAMVGQIHLMCRVLQENAREVANRLVFTILQLTDSDPKVDAFLGKQFLVKEGSLRFAWIFSFSGEDPQYVASVVCEAIEEAVPPKKVEVLESPLMGPGTAQTTKLGVKGAMPVR